MRFKKARSKEKPVEPKEEERSELDILDENLEESPKQKLNTVYIKPVFASALSGAVSKAIVQPFDVLAKKGYKGLWKGHTAVQVVDLFKNMAMFSSYKHLRSKFDSSPFSISPNFCSFQSGFLSGIIAALLTQPLQNFVLSQRAMSKMVKMHGSFAKKAIKPTDIRSLYRGGVLSLAQTSSLYGCKFLFYNMICNYELKDTELSAPYELRTLKLIEVGAVSGALANATVYPIGVIKARLSAHGLHRQHLAFDHTCRSIWQCVGKVIEREGVSGFYKGLLPTVLRGAVNTAFNFSLFDKFLHWADTTIS